MLVLSRKLGEKISIAGGEVELEVLEISGSRVRLGISAPQEYRIARAERFWVDTAEGGLSPTGSLAGSGD